MHSRLHGSWYGTLGSVQGAGTTVEFALSSDSVHRVMVSLNVDRAVTLGAASDVVLKGAVIEWMQRRSGTLCKATAVLSTPAPGRPDTLNGTLACGAERTAFTLRKRAA